MIMAHPFRKFPKRKEVCDWVESSDEFSLRKLNTIWGNVYEITNLKTNVNVITNLDDIVSPTQIQILENRLDIKIPWVF